jgi:hypothetical protein
MAAPGLGRVKTVSQGRRTWEPEPRCVSGHDRSHQRLGTDDVPDPCQIIGEDRESHLGGYFWKRFGEKVCCPIRAFIVSNGCSLYRPLSAWTFGTSRVEIRPRIRLVRWLHTVLNRDSS